MDDKQRHCSEDGHPAEDSGAHDDQDDQLLLPGPGLLIITGVFRIISNLLLLTTNCSWLPGKFIVAILLVAATKKDLISILFFILTLNFRKMSTLNSASLTTSLLPFYCHEDIWIAGRMEL